MALKFGKVSEVDPTKGTVRVEFVEDDLVSFPMPVLVNGSKNNKFFHSFEINEPVVCLMEDDMKNGVCLGAIYNEKTLPVSGLNKDIFSVTFGDGSKVEFNKTTSTIEVEVGTTKIKASPVGLEISKGAESLKNLLVDLVTANSIETHISASPGSPTTPPVNVASYTAIISRLNLFFTS